MRSSFFIIGLLIILSSCKTHLNISGVETNNISNIQTDFAADSSIILLVSPYKQTLESDMSKVIAISNEELTIAKPESKLTNFIADLLMQSGESYCKMNYKHIKLDIAFVNYGGLRSSLPRGQITIGNIFELMPFENTLVLLKVNGKTMLEFVSHLAARGGDGVAGMKLGIKNDAIGTLLIGGKPFDLANDYWIVTNDYIAGGGDDMSMLLNRKGFINTGLKIRDVIIDRLNRQYNSGKHVDIKLDGRIYYE